VPGAGVLVPQAATGRQPTPRPVRRAAEEKELRNPLQRAYLPVIRFATQRRWTTGRPSAWLVLIGTLALVRSQ
jgi:HAE1 family hydrophobic/amphiphilic exporter-1